VIGGEFEEMAKLLSESKSVEVLDAEESCINLLVSGKVIRISSEPYDPQDASLLVCEITADGE
jgi:hypothetical protein